MFSDAIRGPGQESSRCHRWRREQLKKRASRAPVHDLPQRDIRIGGRQSGASFDYTLQADDIERPSTWEPRIRQVLSQLPELEDVNSDVQDFGLQTSLVIDRDAVTRLGLTMAQIDATLNNAFGQRQVGVIYNPLNQYRVVMEAAPRYLQNPRRCAASSSTARAADSAHGVCAHHHHQHARCRSTTTGARPPAASASAWRRGCRCRRPLRR